MSVCEWHLVSICLVQGLTLESECKRTNLHKSFHFSSFCFPAVQCLYSISVSILSTMTLPIHPPWQTFHTESNAYSLGHLILIAKHSNLVYNTHTHTEYTAHTWSYHSKATEKQKVRNPITVRPIGHTETSSCSASNTEVVLRDTHLLSLL